MPASNVVRLLRVIDHVNEIGQLLPPVLTPAIVALYAVWKHKGCPDALTPGCDDFSAADLAGVALNLDAISTHACELVAEIVALPVTLTPPADLLEATRVN